MGGWLTNRPLGNLQWPSSGVEPLGPNVHLGTHNTTVEQGLYLVGWLKTRIGSTDHNGSWQTVLARCFRFYFAFSKYRWILHRIARRLVTNEKCLWCCLFQEAKGCALTYPEDAKALPGNQLFRSNQSQIHNLLSQPCEPPNRPRPVSMPGLTPWGKWKSHRPKFCHQFEVQLRPQLCDVQSEKEGAQTVPSHSNCPLYQWTQNFNIQFTSVHQSINIQFTEKKLSLAPNFIGNSNISLSTRLQLPICGRHVKGISTASFTRPLWEPGNYGQLPKMLENDD